METRAMGIGERVRVWLLIVPTVGIAGGLLLGARAGLAGGDSLAVRNSAGYGLMLMLGAGAVIGGVYVFLNRGRWQINWRTVTVTMLITSALTALLYRLVGAEAFTWLVPAASAETAADADWRTLLGALDGWLYGMGFGGLICIIDRRATVFSAAGAARYAVIYAGVVVGLLIIAMLDFTDIVGETVVQVIGAAYILAFRAGIKRWDRRLRESTPQ